MYDAEHIYGLDIETDNSPGHHGLDPARSSVTQVSLVTATGAFDIETDEFHLLTNLDALLLSLEPGLLVTWNGSFFDMPFLADRAAAHEDTMHPDSWGLRLLHQPGLTPKYVPEAGMTGYTGKPGGYASLWTNPDGSTRHTHLDISQAYRNTAAALGVTWSLKPVAKALGIDMVELDRTRLQDYSLTERAAYVNSDAIGTRLLALRLLGLTS
jgi:uncharacterized protein YprB with RNaseH-like and TPR domain